MSVGIGDELMDAPIDEDGDFAVNLVNENNQVFSQKVELIKDSLSKVWVSGLKNNQKIITRGAGFVQDGDEVVVATDLTN